MSDDQETKLSSSTEDHVEEPVEELTLSMSTVASSGCSQTFKTLAITPFQDNVISSLQIDSFPIQLQMPKYEEDEYEPIPLPNVIVTSSASTSTQTEEKEIIGNISSDSGEPPSKRARINESDDSEDDDSSDIFECQKSELPGHYFRINSLAQMLMNSYHGQGVAKQVAVEQVAHIEDDNQDQPKNVTLVQEEVTEDKNVNPNNSLQMMPTPLPTPIKPFAHDNVNGNFIYAHEGDCNTNDNPNMTQITDTEADVADDNKTIVDQVIAIDASLNRYQNVFNITDRILRPDTPSGAVRHVDFESQDEEEEELGNDEVEADANDAGSNYEFSELDVASDSDLPENPIENHDSRSTSPEDYAPLLLQNLVNKLRSLNTQFFRYSRRSFPTTESDGNGSSNNETDSRFNSVKCDAKNRDKKRLCAQCDTEIPPVFIYCLRCFKIRRNWLPKRPKARRLKLRKIAARRRRYGNSDWLPSPVNELDHIDANSPRSGYLPSDANIDLNNAFVVSEDNPALARLETSSLPGNITICELLTPPSSGGRLEENDKSELKSILPMTLGQKESQNCEVGQVDKSISSDTTCHICCTKPKNAAFVHNKIAHVCCCYTCGDKILKRSGKCPICRERVLRLVKIIDI